MMDLQKILDHDTRQLLRAAVDRATREQLQLLPLDVARRRIADREREEKKYRKSKDAKWKKEGIELTPEGMRCIICGRVSHKFNWRARHFKGCPNSTEGRNDVGG